jgi:hypothetical protein
VIGWYVHHHGRGHLTRLLAVRPHVPGPVTVLSSLPRPAELPADTEWVLLERDDADEGRGDPADAQPTASGLLHWAPVGHGGHARRLAAIAALLPSFDAMVVDVSVEVTMLARLLGRPVALVVQPGDRVDEPHLVGRRLADLAIAPWPGDDGPGIVHVGGISRFAGRARTSDPQPSRVLALGGGERDDLWRATIEHAMEGTPDWQWEMLDHEHWSADPWASLCRAEVVVTAAGQNAIADVAAAGARAVVLPRPRPFDEQERTAAALARRGLAVTAHASAELDWPDLLTRARALRPDWAQWRVDGAAERAALAIDGTRIRA